MIVSTDLSHYHDQRTAERLDRRIADAVVGKKLDAMATADACGVYAVRVLLLVAPATDLDVERLDLRTSADANGPADSLVGYGAFALHPPTA